MSWILQGTGQARTAYQILLTQVDDVFWDSGRIESSATTDIAYGGPPLAGRTRYRWKVQAWDETGAGSGWSAPATFETGFWERTTGWHASWITLGRIREEFRPPSVLGAIAADGWQGAFAAIRHADLLMGERHDLTRELPGWDAPGFDALPSSASGAGSWRPVQLRERDSTPLVPDPGPPVRVTEEITPPATTATWPRSSPSDWTTWPTPSTAPAPTRTSRPRLNIGWAGAPAWAGEAAGYRALAGKLRSSFINAFVAADGQVASGTQTAYVLALHMNLVPEELRDAAAGHLAAAIRREDWHPSDDPAAVRDRAGSGPVSVAGYPGAPGATEAVFAVGPGSHEFTGPALTGLLSLSSDMLQTRGVMARSGSLAAWEQRLAAQRREDDRQARQKKQAERDAERIRQQDHLASRQQEAEDKTAEVQARMKALGEVLTSILPARPLTFERLLAAPKTPEFDPGPLAAARPAPEWKDYAPVPATGLGRLLGGGGRRDRQAAEEARTRFDAAVAEHQRQEAGRRRELAAAKATYDRKVTEERAKTAARNAYVTSRQAAFAARDPEAVQWFAGCVLRASRYPDGFPREYLVTYLPQARCLDVDVQLPAREVVPAVRAYRYVKTRDAVDPVPRAESEISQAHERLVACVALRALHEVFGAMADDLVQAVALTGWVATTDRATGTPVRPRLIDLRADRATFTTLVLDAVDPVACLSHLTTLVPPELAPRPCLSRT